MKPLSDGTAGVSLEAFLSVECAVEDVGGELGSGGDCGLGESD